MNGRRLAAGMLLVCAGALLGFGVLRHLAFPLLWQDELQTVLYGQRVLDHGYPKVHGPRNVYYDIRLDMAQGVKEDSDAYIATPWLQYYFAAPVELWARAAADDRSRTARARLPFALAGLVGVGLLTLSLTRAAGGTFTRRALLAAAYLCMLTSSVSLLLHLREARYYPLVILELGVIFQLHLGGARARPSAFGARPRIFGARPLALAACLVLLFHTFSPAWFSVSAALVIDAVLGARRHSGGFKSALVAAGPVLLSALLVVPGMVFYELLEQAGVQALRAGESSYIGRLADYLYFLLRYEFLAAALGAALLRRLSGPISPEASAMLRFMGLVLLMHVPLVAALPLFFERYVVILSPLLSAVFLLELASLWDAMRARGGRRAGLAFGLAMALCLGSLTLRGEELGGRVEELREPQVGPLDAIIPRIRELHPDPSSLVVATSYEAGAYVYYLGSRVLVGFGGQRGMPQLGHPPDLVVPRHSWLPELELLQPILEAADYRAEVLAVADTATNNLPELWQPRFKWFEHRFERAVPEGDYGRLKLYWLRR